MPLSVCDTPVAIPTPSAVRPTAAQPPRFKAASARTSFIVSPIVPTSHPNAVPYATHNLQRHGHAIEFVENKAIDNRLLASAHPTITVVTLRQAPTRCVTR